jgi:hypothetical protein
VFKSKVLSCPLSSPTRQYALGLTKATEHLAAQVSILWSDNKQKEAILNTRRQQRKGKRKALQGHFMLTTSELRDKVLEAKAETAARKKPRPSQPSQSGQPSQPTKRRKVQPLQKSLKIAQKIPQTTRARYLSVSLSRGADAVGLAKSSPNGHPLQMAISRST